MTDEHWLQDKLAHMRSGLFILTGLAGAFCKRRGEKVEQLESEHVARQSDLPGWWYQQLSPEARAASKQLFVETLQEVCDETMKRAEAEASKRATAQTDVICHEMST